MPAHNPDAGDGTAAAGAGDRHVSLERLTCDRRWVAWRDELRGASDAPVRSIYGATDRAAKSDDPATWVPHDVAWAVRANIDDAGAGIGVMLGCVNGVWLAAVDLISCRNSLTGQFTSRATNLMQRLQTYVEIAPSGNDVTALLLIDPADAPALRVLLEAHPGTPFKQGDGALEQPAAIELHIEDHCLPVTWQALDDTAELRRVPFADLRWLIEQAGATSQGEMADTDAASKANSAADLTGHTPTELALTVSLFKTRHTAYGVMQQMTWRAFTDLFRRRRQGDKTGKNFVLAEFQREPNGRVHRIGANLMARTAIGLDIETSKKTDEIPPPFEDAVERIKARGWAAIVYTSHNHTPALPRFRIVLPISSEIDFKLPVVEVIAKHLDLSGVLDTGKVGAASVFYFPSAEPGQLAHHQTEIISGKPIAAEWITECAAAILAAREAEQKRQRARDLEAATKRREDRIARGLDPDHSIIEAVRDRLDLVGELIGHGYLQVPGRDDLFLYPGSETRVPGVHILTGRDGVQRVYSHHSGDPLAPGNLPGWCKVRAIDVVDVKAILDHGGDQKKALHTLAKKFGIESRGRPTPTPPKEGNEPDDPPPPPPPGEPCPPLPPDDPPPPPDDPDAPDDYDKPEIIVRPSELDVLATKAEDALIAAKAPIFQRGWMLARPGLVELPASKGRKTVSPALVPLKEPGLLDHFCQTSKWIRFDGRKRSYVPLDPPAKVASVLLSRIGRWRLPALSGVISTPTLRHDGSILSTPGFDTETGYYLIPAPGLRVPAISDKPDRSEALAALELIERLLHEFAFIDDGGVSRSVAVSGIMTPVVRAALSVAPLHGVSAKTPGTGKSTLLDTTAAIALGKPGMPVSFVGKSDEEFEKKLNGLLLQGTPLIGLDNILRPLESDLLCQATERPHLSLRRLTRSESFEVPNGSTLYATANNLTFMGEQIRRSLRCDMDAKVERPELRRFRGDPVVAALADRGKYIAAVLTIVRAYLATVARLEIDPIGSYSDWSWFVREPLVWLGRADPVKSMEAGRAIDPVLLAIKAVMAGWKGEVGLNVARSALDVVKAATEAPPKPNTSRRQHEPSSAWQARKDACRADWERRKASQAVFRDALIRVAGDGHGDVSTRRLGDWLGRQAGRPVDGMKFWSPSLTHGGVSAWALTEA